MDYNPIIYYIGQIREKANRLLVNELANNGLDGIVPSHGAILLILFRKRELSMKEIANFIKKDKSTVTALVNKLIKFGYIKKVKCETDSRSSIISLTTKGLDMKGTFENITKRLYGKIDNALSKEEKDKLTELLLKLNNGW